MEPADYELFWEGGDSAGEYHTEADALRAVAAMIERGGGKAAVSQLVLAKAGAGGELIRLAEGEALAAMAARTAIIRRSA